MLQLVGAYLRDGRLTTALNVTLVAVAVAMLTILLSFSQQITQRFSRDVEGVDLVVGAKGSPLQLILSSVFHIDQPTGNIPADSVDLLRRDPAVQSVVPLALGDNFRGFRIVGTEAAFLALHGASLAQGRANAASGEAVLGAAVARATGASLGQKFFGSHGLEDDGSAHEHQPFSVVGILKPTGRVIDRLIVTSVGTVWDMHGIAHGEGAPKHDDAHAHHDHAHDGHAHDDTAKAPDGLQERGALRPEVTALLVTYRNASAAVRIPSVINRQTQMQAAVPATETARFLSLFGASLAGAQVFAWLMAGVAGLAIFVALFNAVRAREGDLALLRVMGASRPFVAGTVVLEGLAVAALGTIFGVALGFGLLWLAAGRFAVLGDLGFEPFAMFAGLGSIALGVGAIAVVAALLPALRVYASDVARSLARN
jgi:putative ABC transport system permease protein